jgi:hypothetical protein
MVKLTLLTLAVLAATPVAAQDLPVGSRIRITKAGGPAIIGTLESEDANHLTFTPQYERHPTLVSRSALTRVEVSRGWRRRTRQGAYAGFGVGLLAGTVAGVSFYYAGDGFTSAVQGAAACGGLGAGTGALVGAGLGALSKRDVWEDVPLDGPKVSVTASPGGGLGLRVHLSW